MGGVFPQGYPVAEVDHFTPPANKQVTATPKAQLDRNRELMVVWSSSKQELLTPKLDEPPAGSMTNGQHLLRFFQYHSDSHGGNGAKNRAFTRYLRHD